MLVAVQDVPSQCSKRKLRNCWSSVNRSPITQTSLAEVAAMAKKCAGSVPNCGLGYSLHCVPFHCSITCTGSCPEMASSPVPHASVGEISITPPSRVVGLPLIVAVGNAVHFVPLKCIVASPEAQMSFAEEAEMAFSLLLKLGLGVLTTLKVVWGTWPTLAGPPIISRAAVNARIRNVLQLIFTMSPQQNVACGPSR